MTIRQRLKRAATTIVNQTPDTLADQDLADALDESERLAKWTKALRTRAQALLAGGEAVPGWHLVENAPERKVDDANLAYQRAGLSIAAFLDCCKVMVGKLAKAVGADLSECATAGAADAELAKRLADALSVTPKAPSLARAVPV